MKIHYHFPVVLDNTQITTYKSCPTKWFYNHVLHLGGENNKDLHFGAAYAAAHEATRKAFYIDQLSPDDALDLGRAALQEYWGDPMLFHEENKNLTNCLMLLELYYTMYYPLIEDAYMPLKLADNEGNEGAAVEFSFMEKIAEHPDLPLPLFYTGRADMVVESPYFGKGKYLVFDDKTTGSYLNARTLGQWETRSQFTAYTWGLQKAGIPAIGAVIALASITKSRMDFDRIESLRPEFMINNWKRDLDRTVQDMKDFYLMMKEKHFADPETSIPGLSDRSNYDASCNAYFKKCWYTPACTQQRGENARLVGADQNIWLPHEQRRGSLPEHLESMGLKPDDYVWTEVADPVDVGDLFSNPESAF